MTETTRPVTKNYRNRIPLNTQTLTKTNYSHYGWEDPNGTKFRTSDTIDLTRDITLTAVWGVSITYYQDDTENSPSYTVPTVYIPSQTYDVLAGTHDNFSAFDVTGKTITSWTEGSTTGTSRAAGYQYNIDSNTVNIKLYAVWTDTYYTLTYYNGSPSYPETNTILKDTLVTVRGRVMANATKIVNSTNSNFGLAGWANTQTGTSVTYDPYGTNSNSLPKTFTIRSNTNLNAVWGTVAGVTVAYTVSNGAAAVTDQNSPYVSGKTVTVLAPTNPDGYTFNRWQLSGTSIYYNPANTFNIASATTLIAQWTAKSIVMSYDTNSSSTVPKPADRTHTYAQSGECKTADISPLIYNNKTFAGWNESSTPSYTGDPLTISSTMYEKNKAFSSTTFKTSKTLYAVWGAQVTYVAASGDTVTNLPPVSSVYISGQTIPITTSTTPAKAIAPKIFIRWNNGSDAATAIVVDLNTTNKTYTAVWGANVTYEGNGSTSGTSPTTVATAKGDVISDGSLFVKDGWSIQKWNTSANITGTDYALSYTNSSFPSANITLYAVWGPEITIDYSANDGSFKTGQTSTGHSVFYNQQFTTRSSSTAVQYDDATRTFQNWNTLSDGSGTSFNSNSTQSYTLSDVPENNTQTLYAIWRVTVTYTNGSSTHTDTTKYKNDDTIDVKSQSNTGLSVPSGKRFTGWLYNSTTYQADDTIDVSATTSNIAFTMQTVTSITITYKDPKDNSTISTVNNAIKYLQPPKNTDDIANTATLGWSATAYNSNNANTITANFAFHPMNTVTQTSNTNLYLLRSAYVGGGYTITLNRNGNTGGSVSPTSWTNQSVNDEITLSGANLVKNGRSFSHWSASNGATFNSGTRYFVFLFLPYSGNSNTRLSEDNQTYTLTANYN